MDFCSQNRLEAGSQQEFFKGRRWGGGHKRVSMGLTDRRKTAKNLVDSRKN